ncbi:MAG: hypothetical protein NZM02_00365 [Patescibacteria group bacterium]|nr:hypothetical protein [Patescibacteria group bacterium]
MENRKPRFNREPRFNLFNRGAISLVIACLFFSSCSPHNKIYGVEVENPCGRTFQVQVEPEYKLLLPGLKDIRVGPKGQIPLNGFYLYPDGTILAPTEENIGGGPKTDLVILSMKGNTVTLTAICDQPPNNP